MIKKTSIAYTKVPSSLSVKVLERFVSKEQLDKLKKEYVEERNKSFKRGDRGNYCPNCGHKLQVIKNNK